MRGDPAGARWDPGTFDVIYTSLAREGALEEIYFHLSRQPVFPSMFSQGPSRQFSPSEIAVALGRDAKAG